MWGSANGVGLDQWSPRGSQSSHQSRVTHRSARWAVCLEGAKTSQAHWQLENTHCCSACSEGYLTNQTKWELNEIHICFTLFTDF